VSQDWPYKPLMLLRMSDGGSHHRTLKRTHGQNRTRCQRMCNESTDAHSAAIKTSKGFERRSDEGRQRMVEADKRMRAVSRL